MLTDSSDNQLLEELSKQQEQLLELLCEPRQLAAGSQFIGKTGVGEVSITGTCGGANTVAAAGDYADNDVVSNSATAGVPWWFPGAARVPGGGGIIKRFTLSCSTAAVVASWRLHLFTEPPITSALNDNVAFDLKNADRLKWIGFIDLTALADIGDPSANCNSALNFQFVCAPDSRDLWAILQITDADANESAGMTIIPQLGITQTT